MTIKSQAVKRKAVLETDAAAWTEAEEKIVTVLWNEGKSLDDIRRALFKHNEAVAKETGEEPKDRTNLKIQSRVTAMRKRGTPLVSRRRGRSRLQNPMQATAETTVDESTFTVKKLPLVDLEDNMCRWPVGDEKGTTLFCGNKTEGRSPYCFFHKRK